MICPHCGWTEEGDAVLCDKCGNSFDTVPDVQPDVELGADPCIEPGANPNIGPSAKPPGRSPANIWTVVITVCIAVVLVAAGVFFYIVPREGEVKVSLQDPYGNSLGSVSVTKSGLIDLNQLEARENSFTTQNGLTFAGWYTDKSLNTPLKKFAKVSGSITLYSDWNNLSFDLVQIEKAAPDNNTKDCTFTNTTAPDPLNTIVSTDWTIVDSFKSDHNEIVKEAPSIAPGNVKYDINLNKGMYDVTMTVTFDNGAGGTIVKSKTECKVVDGTITHAVTGWTDYRSVSRTLTFEFETQDYIKFAKKNWERNFSTNSIADFADYDSKVIKDIRDQLEDMFENGGTPLSKQDQANLIASFVNVGIGTKYSVIQKYINLGYKYTGHEGYYYKLPGQSEEKAEYYKYPLESLYDMVFYETIGDCEDHSILTASIAKACGFDSALIVLTYSDPDDPEMKLIGHAVAGIKDDGSFVPPSSIGGYKFLNVKGYYGCETYRYEAAPRLGNVESKYQGIGWTQRAHTVT